MPRFDVYELRQGRAGIPWVVDVQADLLDQLGTRMVIPLIPPETLNGRRVTGLMPELEIHGRVMVLLTPEMAGLPRRALGLRVGSVADRRVDIVRAIDLLLEGI